MCDKSNPILNFQNVIFTLKILYNNKHQKKFALNYLKIMNEENKNKLTV